jgi:hypothetical protein
VSRRRSDLAAGDCDQARSLDSYGNTAKVAVVHLNDADDSEKAKDAVRASTADTEADIRDLEEDEAMTRQGLDLLASKRNDAYEAALAALREDTQGWWQELLDRDADELEHGEKAYTADVEGLRRFIETEVMPWFENRRRHFANRPLVRDQAFGESLEPDKLEKLGRYEVHLDRKLERTLAMLLKLKELRGGTAEG